MDDREMLALAAKAAGAEIELRDESYIRVLKRDADTFLFTSWNPLTDDGDALRLAAALKMDIVYRYDGVGAGDLEEGFAGSGMFGARHEAEPSAAYRRAIVRAAAEVGKAMP